MLPENRRIVYRSYRDVAVPRARSCYLQYYFSPDIRGKAKMVRFVHFIVALVALGVTAGDPIPSSKGELSLERKGDLEASLNRQVYDSRVSATNDSS